MEYLRDSNVVVAQSQDEEDEAFQRAAREDEPLLVVREKRKYAAVRVDMQPAYKFLEADAVEEVRDVMDEYREIAYGTSEHKERPVEIGSSRGGLYVRPLLISDARECARRIEHVVFDEANHRKRGVAALREHSDFA